MVWSFCQAGGTNKRIARNKLTPPASKASNILSMLDESEPVIPTKGRISSILSINDVANLVPRANAQFRLPWTVLISPLCAR